MVATAQIVSVRQCDETVGTKSEHADRRPTAKSCQTAAPELPLNSKPTPAPMNVGQFPKHREKGRMHHDLGLREYQSP
jgi:hypothetical protein